MGEVTDLSIEDLVENSGKPYKVLEPSKSQRPNYECSGTLTADNVSIDESNTLADVSSTLHLVEFVFILILCWFSIWLAIVTSI